VLTEVFRLQSLIDRVFKIYRLCFVLLHMVPMLPLWFAKTYDRTEKNIIVSSVR